MHCVGFYKENGKSIASFFAQLNIANKKVALEHIFGYFDTVTFLNPLVKIAGTSTAWKRDFKKEDWARAWRPRQTPISSARVREQQVKVSQCTTKWLEKGKNTQDICRDQNIQNESRI